MKEVPDKPDSCFFAAMELHEKIIAARKKKGLTQEELAGLTNITTRSIQRIESGETTPRAYTLKAIAKALEIPFEELLSPATENTNEKAFQNTVNPGTENDSHFLQTICLSCFSYLVIPMVHFLIPARLLKRAGDLPADTRMKARKIIFTQVYWSVALVLSFFFALGYNLIRAQYYQKTGLVHYVWVMLVLYLVNAFIILKSLLQIRS